MAMTARERVECTLHLQEPDRVPWDAVFTIYAYKNLAAHLGIAIPADLGSNVLSSVHTSLDMAEALGLDVYHVGLRPGSRAAPFDFNADTYVDEWGVGYRRALNGYGEGMHCWELAYHPLAGASLADLDRYPWPDPLDPARTAGLAEQCRDLYQNTPFALLGHFNVPPFFYGIYLRGLEQWFTDLVQDPEFADALLDRVTRIAMELDRVAMEACGPYISILRCAGDDLGSDRGPLISPRTFRKVVKPHLARLYANGRALIAQYAPRARLCIHTDGDIFALIPDMIESGVQVLNCVQPVGRMDHDELKRQFGDRIAFHGGLDIRTAMSEGGRAGLEAAVKQCIAKLAPGGGYILAPTNYVLPDVPVENLAAVGDAVRRWGQYPLSWLRRSE